MATGLVPRVKMPETKYTRTCQPCWLCSRQLGTAKGKGFAYVELEGEDGHLHPVHLSCFKYEQDDAVTKESERRCYGDPAPIERAI